MPGRYLFLFLLVCMLVPAPVFSQAKDTSTSQPETSDKMSPELTLRRAVICERVKEFAPEKQAVVFSVTTGKIFCYTHFDPVPEKTDIYHSW